MSSQVLYKSTVDIISDGIIEHIVDKLLFSGSIDNHNSLYFFALP